MWHGPKWRKDEISCIWIFLISQLLWAEDLFKEEINTTFDIISVPKMEFVVTLRIPQTLTPFSTFASRYLFQYLQQLNCVHVFGFPQAISIRISTHDVFVIQLILINSCFIKVRCIIYIYYIIYYTKSTLLAHLTLPYEHIYK